MSDRERLCALLDDFGIKHAVASDRNDDAIAERIDKHEGYGGFYADFVFDEAGAFLKLGIWMTPAARRELRAAAIGAVLAVTYIAFGHLTGWWDPNIWQTFPYRGTA